MNFRLRPLRFAFCARESIFFPAGKSGNILRGAFGKIFRGLACAPDCPGAKQCPDARSCPYALMFEPAAVAGASGFADLPRPFVFRATHLDGCTIAPGDRFFFDVNLFDLRDAAVAHLEQAFAQFAEAGLGPGRGRCTLTEASQLDECGGRAVDRSAPLEISLAPEDERIGRLRVRFVTPTELKSGEQVAAKPEFGILMNRIRDRVSKLRELYDEGPLVMEFRAFGERAQGVRMTRCDIARLEVNRRSSRTGQVHSLGGFTGEAEYEGDLAEFLPFLRAAKWTGVGRQTVWGKGHIETTVD